MITGFRDSKIEEMIVSMGGTIQNTINSKTTLVIAKDINNTSSKVNKAKELNIKLMSLSELKKIINKIEKL